MFHLIRFRFLFVDDPNEVFRDIIGGDVEGATGQRDYDALLSGHAGDAPSHAFVDAFDYYYLLVVEEAALLHDDLLQMLAVGLCGQDEVRHLLGGYDQRRVVASFVGGEMVVIVGEEQRQGESC